jgi:hypothetical protein
MWRPYVGLRGWRIVKFSLLPNFRTRGVVLPDIALASAVVQKAVTRSACFEGLVVPHPLRLAIPVVHVALWWVFRSRLAQRCLRKFGQ